MKISKKNLEVKVTLPMIKLFADEISPKAFEKLGTSMDFPLATLEQMRANGRIWKRIYKYLLMEWKEKDILPTVGKLFKLMEGTQVIDVMDLEQKLHAFLWKERRDVWKDEIVKIQDSSSQTGSLTLTSYNSSHNTSPDGLTLMLLHVSDVWTKKDTGSSLLTLTLLAHNTLVWGDFVGDTIRIQELKRKLNKAQWIHVHEYTLEQHPYKCPSMPKKYIFTQLPCDVTVLESATRGLSCVPVPDPVTTYPPLYKLSQLADLKDNNIDTVRVGGVIKRSDMKMVRTNGDPWFDTELHMTLIDETGTAVSVKVGSDEIKNKLLKAKGEYHHIEWINLRLDLDNHPPLSLYDDTTSIMKIKKDKGHLEVIYNRTFTPQPVVFTKEEIKEFQKFYSQDEVLC